MRRWFAAVVVVVSCAAGPRARAQVVVGRMQVTAPYPGYAVVPATESATTYPAGYVPPDSYYAAPYPYPARQYVGSSFPFYGRPYGHPYDAWTWPYVGGTPYYGGRLARYYYPPLGW